MRIREETPADNPGISDLHLEAFGEHGTVVNAVVASLRQSHDRTSVSLVADEDERIVGHVLFSEGLLDAPRRLVSVHILSPLAVQPDHQHRGIGSALVARGIDLLMQQETPLVFLEGSPAFYSRLGFVAAVPLGFRKPSLRIPDAAFQVYVMPSYAEWMTGTVVYPDAFWQHDAVGLR